MDSSDTESFQRQALPVPPIDKNFDPEKVPETGEHYLQHVLYERKNCPDVVRASMPPPSSVKSSRRIEKVFSEDDQTVPVSQKLSTVEWQEIQLANFNKLRDHITLMNDTKKNNVSDSDIELPDIDEKDAWEVFCKGNQPLVSTIISIRAQNMETLLEYMHSWLQEPANESWITLWIYACLVYIFVPLEPNMCSVLREIARTCRQLRTTNLDPERNLSYSLLICIISAYFRQLDLSDTFN